MNIRALLAKREALISETDEILASISEDESLSAEQADRIDAISAEVKAIDGNIERLRSIDSLRKAPEGTTERMTDGEVKVIGERVLEDPMKGFKHLGEFAAAVAEASMPSRRVDERLALINAAASGNQQAVGADGGFLVPSSFSETIWNGLNNVADSLLARTDNYTVSGDSLTIPANAETSRANGSRWGGVQGYWIAEADQITTSKPTFRQMKLEPQQLAVLCYATDKLLRNATALEQWLTRAATDEINFKVGDAIVNGTGAGMPMGLLTSASAVSVAKEAGQAASTIVYENIVKMWSRLHPSAQARAIWLHNVDVFPELAALSLDVGTGGQPVFVPAGGLSNAPFSTLLSRPLVPCEFCATLGTVGDLILVDLGGYATGTKGGIDAAMSMHLRFDYAETAFRWMFDVDGQPWLASALTPFKGSNTLSTHVSLATRA